MRVVWHRPVLLSRLASQSLRCVRHVAGGLAVINKRGKLHSGSASGHRPLRVRTEMAYDHRSTRLGYYAIVPMVLQVYVIICVCVPAWAYKLLPMAEAKSIVIGGGTFVQHTLHRHGAVCCQAYSTVTTHLLI